MEKTEVLKAQSPAALAEEFIVKSIWNNRFPVGSELPAERILAEMIGITRTTLREVLQRLARDGWVSIHHGKMTKVNDIWETGGPNVIDTLIRLDDDIVATIITNVVSLRTRMGAVYIPEAVRLNPAESAKLFIGLENLEDTATAYAEFDYALYRRFTFVANKPVYGLILNSFKDLYQRVASLVFHDPVFRQETFAFYTQFRAACEAGDDKKVAEYLDNHRQYSSSVWADVLKNLPHDLDK